MRRDAIQVTSEMKSRFSSADAQEVSSGYMRTEIGVIPEDWDVVPLRSLCKQIVDGTHFTPRYVADGVPFYSVENVSADDFDNVKFISRSEHEALMRRCKPERNDILLTRIGSLGDTKLIDWEVDASIYVSLALLKVREGVDARFLYCYMQGRQFVLDVEHRSLLNAAPKKINMGDIGAVPIVMPQCREEQRAIAEALSDVDALLGALDALIAKKRAIKQAAVQQLLTGKTRLPGFHGEWGVKRLGDVCRISTGKKDVNEGNPDGQFPFFTCSRSYTFSDSYSFDTEAILIAGNGDVGNLHYCHGRFEAYQRTYVLFAFSAHVRYLWQQLSAHLADSLGLGKIGSSIPYIKKGNLVEFEFDSPRDPAEEVAIATVLSDIDGEIAALEARRDKIHAIKNGMMQQLLTGRSRLVEAQAA